MTPRHLVVLFALLAALLPGMVALGGETAEDDPQDATPTPSGPLFDVEHFMEGGPKVGGPLRLRGVVGQVRADRKLFSLADLSDRAELLEDGKTKCVTLPVRWTGSMPALHQVVLVQGMVQDHDGQLVFVASSVAPLPGEALP